MFKSLPIDGLVLISLKRFEDGRGFFRETYAEQPYKDAGIACDFVQDNQSLSHGRGVVRGLHFQGPPAAQAKLVRCSVGAIFDVAVDIRNGSPTYGTHVAVELSAENGHQLFVPEGFAHGFCTLTEEALVEYKVSSHYAPDTEGGIRWNDPALGIDWPVGADTAILSQKDRSLGRLDALLTPFDYRNGDLR